MCPPGHIGLADRFSSDTGIDWQTETLTDSYVSTLLRETLRIEIVDDYQLQQVVTFPTRGNNLLLRPMPYFPS